MGLLNILFHNSKNIFNKRKEILYKNKIDYGKKLKIKLLNILEKLLKLKIEERFIHMVIKKGMLRLTLKREQLLLKLKVVKVKVLKINLIDMLMLHQKNLLL